MNRRDFQRRPQGQALRIIVVSIDLPETGRCTLELRFVTGPTGRQWHPAWVN